MASATSRASRCNLTAATCRTMEFLFIAGAWNRAGCFGVAATVLVAAGAGALVDLVATAGTEAGAFATGAAGAGAFFAAGVDFDFGETAAEGTLLLKASAACTAPPYCVRPIT